MRLSDDDSTAFHELPAQIQMRMREVQSTAHVFYDSRCAQGFATIHELPTQIHMRMAEAQSTVHVFYDSGCAQGFAKVAILAGA